MSWTRRDFIRLSSFAAAAGALVPRRLHGLLSEGSARSLHGLHSEGSAQSLHELPPEAPPRRLLRQDFRTLRGNVGIFTQRGGTIGWMVNPEGIAVVDSQFPDTATSFLGGLEGREGRPVDLLLNTHHHGDHVGGNPTFRPETSRIVAHEEARRLHAAGVDEEGTAGLADETFAERWSAEIGGDRIGARHYGPAHTGGDAVVHFENANVVHMGDLIFNRVYPFIDRPGGASVQGWLELTRRVVADHDADTIFIFGHGHPDFGIIGSREDVQVQGDFLEAILEVAQGAIREGRSREEVMALTSVPGFPDHQAIAERLSAGAAVAAAWEELSERDRAE